MAKLLWRPSEDKIKNSNIYRFMNFINERHHQDFKEYEPLYQWSIDNISDFWASFWEFAQIKFSKPYDRVIDDVSKMPGAKWFEGARLNFAENLLSYTDDRIALIFRGEDQVRREVTY
ncbi:MAG: acetoacetate--CoA ligase, partial [Desulfobacteraceae bacterium]|nr:acetoacetate--CoA ligase [Desulfobacteraceae bacterium]